MKTFMKYLFCFFMVCAVGMMAQAADKSVNRKMGYFDNTRTVLLFCHRAMIEAAMPHHTLQRDGCGVPLPLLQKIRYG